MDDVTFAILKLVISICAMLLTAYIAPYYKALSESEKYAQLVGIVDAAVMTAEQTMKVFSGAAKKINVETQVLNWMKQHNVKMSAEQINSLIESAVYAIKQAKDGKDGEIQNGNNSGS